jgi:predicted HTH domain antitoxin
MTSPFVNEERLAGLAISYEAYREQADSTFTKRSRIVFEENSGLANIEPADIILELLQRADVKEMDAKIP